MKTNENTLGRVRAVWDALRGADMSHFPLLAKEEMKDGESLDDAIVSQIVSVLNAVEHPAVSGESGIESVMAKARETLDEVKGLTEYQDQKATRLLTIISFLSALAAALFTRFSTAYSLQDYLIGPCINWRATGVVVSYILFGAFVLCAVGGALVVFFATQTRFKWPKRTDGPRSRLFYAGILSASPSAWAKSFVDESKQPKEFVSPAKLQMAYTKDYLLEGYLVAAKVADKLRYLEPAQRLLYLAVKVLLAWVILIGVVSVTV
jgi:hypothetical protein